MVPWILVRLRLLSICNSGPTWLLPRSPRLCQCLVGAGWADLVEMRNSFSRQWLSLPCDCPGSWLSRPEGRRNFGVGRRRDLRRLSILPVRKVYDCVLKCRPPPQSYIDRRGATAWPVRSQFGITLHPLHFNSCIAKAAANDEAQSTMYSPLGPVSASQVNTSRIGNTMPGPIIPALTITLELPKP